LKCAKFQNLCVFLRVCVCVSICFGVLTQVHICTVMFIWAEVRRKSPIWGLFLYTHFPNAYVCSVISAWVFICASSHLFLSSMCVCLCAHGAFWMWLHAWVDLHPACWVSHLVEKSSPSLPSLEYLSQFSGWTQKSNIHFHPTEFTH